MRPSDLERYRSLRSIVLQCMDCVVVKGRRLEVTRPIDLVDEPVTIMPGTSISVEEAVGDLIVLRHCGVREATETLRHVRQGRFFRRRSVLQCVKDYTAWSTARDQGVRLLRMTREVLVDLRSGQTIRDLTTPDLRSRPMVADTRPASDPDRVWAPPTSLARQNKEGASQRLLLVHNR